MAAIGFVVTRPSETTRRKTATAHSDANAAVAGPADLFIHLGAPAHHITIS
jgi:hypothetical protein